MAILHDLQDVVRCLGCVLVVFNEHLVDGERRDHSATNRLDGYSGIEIAQAVAGGMSTNLSLSRCNFEMLTPWRVP